MNNKPERRKFNRFLITLEVEVFAEDIEGDRYDDKVVLKNISGGGAKFITQQSAKYFSGQPLEIIISLPGTNDVKAHMRGKATVVRTSSPSDSGVGEKSKGICIAVKFDTPLNLERDDIIKEEGNRKLQEKI